MDHDVLDQGDQLCSCRLALNLWHHMTASKMLLMHVLRCFHRKFQRLLVLTLVSQAGVGTVLFLEECHGLLRDG